MSTNELRAGREPSKLIWPDDTCIEAEPGVTMKIVETGSPDLWVLVSYVISDESLLVNTRHLAMIEFED